MVSDPYEPIREILDEHRRTNPEFIARINARIEKDRAILARLAEQERPHMADNMGANPNPPQPMDLPGLARKVVFDYVADRLEKTDLHITFALDEVYVVWFAFTLGNWKALVSTSLPDGRYYEVTYNPASTEIYLDAYVKIDNIKVKI